MKPLTSYAKRLDLDEGSPTQCADEKIKLRSNVDARKAPPNASPNVRPISLSGDAVSPINGIVIGCVAATEPDGARMIDYPGNPVHSPLPATTASLPGNLVPGQEVALMFEGGDPLLPIIIGPIDRSDRFCRTAITTSKANRLDVSADGERVALTADKEIVLRCGDASITLTRTGKILIRGAYVLSRATGANRIKGGSVQIN